MKRWIFLSILLISLTIVSLGVISSKELIQNETIFSGNILESFASLGKNPSQNNPGKGGASVPVTEIAVNNEGAVYNVKPGRLSFEISGKSFGLQIRKIKQDYIKAFIIRPDVALSEEDFDSNSFILNIGEIKELDLDNDGDSDIYIKLAEIKNPASNINSHRSSGIFIKRLE